MPEPIEVLVLEDAFKLGVLPSSDFDVRGTRATHWSDRSVSYEIVRRAIWTIAELRRPLTRNESSQLGDSTMVYREDNRTTFLIVEDARDLLKVQRLIV